jgi:hypothetical protein
MHVLSVAASLSMSRQVAGQASVPDSLSSSLTSAIPLVVAGFAEPNQSINWTQYRTPEACQSLFEWRLRLANYDEAIHYEHTSRARAYSDDNWVPLAPEAVSIGQACLRQFQVTDVPVFALSSLLRLAIGANADSLIQAIVTRELTQAGTASRDRAEVLWDVIQRLMSNNWDEGNGTIIHLTSAHTQLARRYTAQLDSVGGPEILLYRVWAEEFLSRGYRVDDTTGGAQLAELEHRLEQLEHAPISEAPSGDQQKILIVLLGLKINVRWWEYLHTLSHADLTRWVATRDSVKHRLVGGLGQPDSLAGTPAPQITGDYWFNSGGVSAPVVPAPGAVSLLVFDNPGLGGTRKLGARQLQALRHLHQTFPALHIVVVAATQGTFQGHAFETSPDSEAQVIHQYYDSLQIPGIISVSKSTYRTVVGGHAIPLPVPVLSRYKLDPRNYSGKLFLVDPSGWVVSRFLWGAPDLELLIRRLLEQAPTTSTSGKAISTGTQQSDSIPSAKLKWLVNYNDPSVVYFHGIRLTTAQRDSLQVLLEIQLTKGQELFREARSGYGAPAGTERHNDSEQARKASMTLFAGIRTTNRAQLRAVLTPAQQQQFDRNILQYDDQVAKQRVRYNPWW